MWENEAKRMTVCFQVFLPWIQRGGASFGPISPIPWLIEPNQDYFKHFDVLDSCQNCSPPPLPWVTCLQLPLAEDMSFLCIPKAESVFKSDFAACCCVGNGKESIL